MILKSSHNAIFSQGLEVGVMPYDSPGYQMTLDFGQDHVHVKPSLFQERKKDLKTKDICGPSSQNSLTSAGLQLSLENRLKRQLNMDGSILFKMTWKDAATPAHRRYCLLRALAHRTFDTACSGGGISLANPCELRVQRESNMDGQGTEPFARSCDQRNGGSEQLENPDSFGCRGRYSQSRLRTPIERFPINGEEQLFSRFNFWSGAEWRIGQDEKIRPVEPGTFPLAYGVPARVGRLRGYGNAIVPQVAAEFIKAFLGAKNDLAFKGQRA